MNRKVRAYLVGSAIGVGAIACVFVGVLTNETAANQRATKAALEAAIEGRVDIIPSDGEVYWTLRHTTDYDDGKWSGYALGGKMYRTQETCRREAIHQLELMFLSTSPGFKWKCVDEVYRWPTRRAVEQAEVQP